VRVATPNDLKLSDGGGLAARLLRWVCGVAAGMTDRSRSLQRMVRRRFPTVEVVRNKGEVWLHIELSENDRYAKTFSAEDVAELADLFSAAAHGEDRPRQAIKWWA